MSRLSKSEGGQVEQDHPTLDSPLQRRTLVAGEVRTPGLPHHREQFVKLVL